MQNSGIIYMYFIPNYTHIANKRIKKTKGTRFVENKDT